MITVGPPKAMLSIAVIEPGIYPVKFETSIQDRKISIRVNIALPINHNDKYRKAIGNIKHFKQKATVLLIPGYGLSKETMLPYAVLLASAKYKVILIDLRGQGQSTGDFITYGALESNDLVQVISQLEENHTIVGHLGLIGVSYGAAIALETAAKCPIIASVVAIEPFAQVRSVIPSYVRFFDPQEDRYLGTTKLDSALKYAGQLTGYKILGSGPINTVAKIKSPILYLVGRNDVITLPAEVNSLAARSYDSTIFVIQNQDHLSLLTSTQNTWPIIERWLNANLDSKNK